MRDEGVAEGAGGLEAVAVEEDVWVCLMGDEVGEQAVVEHELHNGRAEGGAFRDSFDAAGFHVGDIDAGGLFEHRADVSEHTAAVIRNVIGILLQKLGDGALVGWEGGFAELGRISGFFKFAIRADVRELVDDAVDDFAVNDAPNLQLARHTRFSKRLQALDDVPDPQSPCILLAVNVHSHRLMNLVLELLVHHRSLFHSRCTPLPPIFGEIVPVL